MIEIVLAAAAVTCVLAAVARAAYVERLGGWAVGDVLVIAWARQFPERTLVLYGMVALSGRRLVNVVVAITIGFALFYGPVAMAPELAACLAAAAYPAGWLARRP
jgi:hypothetical protein